MWKNRVSPRGTAAVVVGGGQRASVRLLNNTRIHWLDVTVRAQVQVTTLTTALLNQGKASALLEFYLNENGRDRWTIDGRVASFLTAALSPSALSNIRQSVLTVGTYNLVERVRLFMGAPDSKFSLVPSETTFAEADPRAPFTLDCIALPNGFSRLFTGGAGTINSISIEVEQNYVAEGDGPLPYYCPVVRQQIENIPGANAQYPIFIKTPNRLRGLIITQESDRGEESDIITAMAIRGDSTDIIGPGQMTYDNIAAQQEMEFGGSVYFPTDAQRKTSHVALWFQKYGRLSNAIFPSVQYNNLRLELNTGVSGGANPKVRVTLLELERPQVMGGRQVVAPPNAVPAEVVR